MRLTKPGVALSIIGVSAFFGFFAIQYFDSHKTPELESAQSAPAEVVAQASPVNGQNASNQLPPGVKVPPLPPDVEKLNAIQKELAALSPEQLEQEVTSLKAKLKQNDLLNRMKEEKLVGTEKEEAKQMLIRLALVNVEKAKRGAPRNKKPPLAGNSLDGHAAENDGHDQVE